MVKKKSNSESEENNTTEVQKIIMEKKEELKREEKIMTDDDELLFSLNIIGSIKRDEKMIQKDNLISIDNRWPFQNLRRWWSDDNREKCANNVLIIISKTEKRILELLNNNNKNNEQNRLINKYFIALNDTKKGLENSRETYDDQFTKNKFSLSIQKTEDLLNKLQNNDNYT